ncbi:nitroreductase family protein [Oscillatoria sp. CS-180]|uniref:nitroreductase family protein n=1 Tax=Oscillatoria sp. CS-180 TaxID=3021720 RepID=UPI00232DC51E|nr:nitroreductase family protein [Oscillatoria sp. CS-180]MDB9529525.1 nitroreductase family protein [Oscillatoria sp. CS-180]
MSASLSTPLDTFTAIEERRSIKTFKDEPIPSDILRRLVELTVAAPSSYNLQDWRIVLVQSKEQKQTLAEAAFGQQQVLEAPVTFVFAARATAWRDESLMEQIYQTALEREAWPPKTVDYFREAIPQFQENLGPKTREYAVKDAMIAATHTALAAQAMGLSTCYMNGWQEDKVKEVIGAADDPDLAIALLLPVGFAAESRKNPGRLPLSVNVFVDRLGNGFGA